MIDDTSEAVQRSVVSILTADIDVMSIQDKRLFDRVPPEPSFPYTAFGEFQVIPENGDGLQGAQIYMTLHTWSRPKAKTGSIENKQLGRAIIKALDDVDLSTSDVRVNSCLLESSNYIDDPDGLTSHGIHVFSILTD